VPVSIELFEKGNGARIREEYLVNGFERIMLFAGRLAKQKNLINFLRVLPEIFKAHPELLFLIIGEGKEKIHLEETIREMKIEKNIRLIGNIPYTEMPDYFAACDLFVLPSNYEGFARVLMEAAMTGKPIVTTNVSGVSDIIEDGISGLVSQIGDMDKFKMHILKIIKNEEFAKSLGEKAKKSFKNKFDTKVMIEKQIRFWKAACKDS
jgi:glycosyltransferase involved in cell wall biosynthesis